MKRRGAAVQGLLGLVGLGAAYATWQREPEQAPGEVVVIEVTRGDLTKVRLDDGQKWVELEQRRDDDGPAIWMRTSARSETKAPERLLRASEEAKRLYERFAPLRATRALGTLGADKLKELGLAAAKKHLEVMARGETRSFLVGAPIGVADPYVKDERDGRVYVLGGGLLGELESASTRLIDRALHRFKLGEADGVTVKSGAKQRTLRTVGNEPLVKLSTTKSPDKADDLASNWHDKIWRLVVTEALGQGETPAAGAPTVALRVEYMFRGRSRGFLELGRVALPPPAATSAPTPSVEVYARTERTTGWIKVPTAADELIKEADKIVAAE